MKCPHCNKTKRDGEKNNWVFEKASKNVEFYGSNSFVFKCQFCNKKYRVYFQRKVIMDTEIMKAKDTDDLSFG